MGQGIRQFKRSLVMVSTMACASPVVADVTPADVWDQWAGYLSSFGYTVENLPVAEGNNLRFPTFSMTMYIPSDPELGVKGGTVHLDAGEVTLTDLGDGTVGIAFPTTMPLTVKGDGPGDQDFFAQMTLTAEGHRTIASGVPNDITYDFTATRLGATMDAVEGKQGRMPMPGTIAVWAEGAAGRNRIAQADGVSQVNQTFRVDRLSYDVEVTEVDPGNPATMGWQGEISGLRSTSQGVVPPEVNPLAIDKALAEGYVVNTLVEFDKGQGSFSFKDSKTENLIRTGSNGGQFKLGMSEAGLVYDLLTEGVTLAVAGSNIPFPVNTTATALGVGISVPVIAGEAEQPFGVSMTITDLVVPDQFWMMADPTGGLPHDPLTFEVDFTGKTRLFVDIMNEAAMSNLDKVGGVPGELTELVLNGLRISGAGALVQATADFDVDNDGQNPMNPKLPAVAGQANLQLTGVTTLLNKLGQMGLIPMQQALIGAGMIQQLGQPGPGVDEYTADIDLAPSGALSINGMPLPLR